jgi:hypothetical protein
MKILAVVEVVIMVGKDINARRARRARKQTSSHEAARTEYHQSCQPAIDRTRCPALAHFPFMTYKFHIGFTPFCYRRRISDRTSGYNTVAAMAMISCVRQLSRQVEYKGVALRCWDFSIATGRDQRQQI